MCSCTLGCWAKIVAWLHCIASGILFCLVTILVFLALIGGYALSEAQPTPGTPVDQKDVDLAVAVVVTGLVALLIIEIVLLISFVADIYLLKGIYQEKPRYMKGWLACKSTLIILLFILILLNTFYGDPKVLSKLTSMIVVSIIYFLIIYFYWKKKREDVARAAVV